MAKVKAVTDIETKVSEKSDEPNSAAVYEINPKLDRSILWKRDLILVPVMGIMYTVLFLDRTNIANARIEGMATSLNLPSNGYNVALTVFYIPFILAEVPFNLLLDKNKFKPAYLLGTQMFLLGILGFCQAFVHNYGSLIVLRFLLGTFESSLPAAGTYFIATYYTKKEAGLRFAFFFNCALAGPLFSGLLAYAIRNLDGKGGLDGWRWIFLIEGLMTVVMSFAVFLLCPNLPHEAQSWFLKPHERERLLYNLEQSRGSESTGSAVDNVPIWKILLDWRIHLFTMCFFCCDITAGSVAGFAPTILTELGWTTSRAQLMTMPIWGIGIVGSFSITVIASKVNFRTPFMLAVICIQLIGWGILKVYPASANIRYMALFFLSLGTYPQMPTYMAWLATNLRGRKYLAVGMAWMVAFSNAANFIASNVFITAESPRYPTAATTAICFSCLGFCLVLSGYIILKHKNKQREERRAHMTEAEKVEDDKLNFEFVL